MIDMPKRPSGSDLLKVIEHWMVEAAASFMDAGEYSRATTMSETLKNFRAQWDDLKPQGWQMPPMIRDLALGGNVIQAIKETRSATWLGLKEAKDLIEEFLRVSGNDKYTHVSSMWSGKISKDGFVQGLHIPKP